MFIVSIRNNKTMEVRRYTEPDECWDDGFDYMWTEGNYGCDCNRALYFERAIGADETEAWNQECGESDYSVLLVETGEGEKITGIDGGRS